MTDETCVCVRCPNSAIVAECGMHLLMRAAALATSALCKCDGSTRQGNRPSAQELACSDIPGGASSLEPTDRPVHPTRD